MALGVGLLLSRLLGVHIERVGLNGLTGLVAYGVELDGMCIRSEQVKIQLVLWAFISNVFTRTTNRELLRITLCDVSLRVVNEADTTHVIERARSFVGRASRLRFIRFEADQISIHSAPVASRLGKTLEVKGVALGGQATDLDQSDKGLDTILRQVAQSMLFQEGTRRSYLMRSPWKAAANTRWVWTAADGSFASIRVSGSQLCLSLAIGGPDWRDAISGASRELRRSSLNESFEAGRLEVSFTIGEPWMVVVVEARSLTLFSANSRFECEEADVRISQPGQNPAIECNLGRLFASFNGAEDIIISTCDRATVRLSPQVVDILSPLNHAAKSSQFTNLLRIGSAPPAFELNAAECELYIAGSSNERFDATLADTRFEWDPRQTSLSEDAFGALRAGCISSRLQSSGARASYRDYFAEATCVDVIFENAASVARKFRVEPDDGNLAIARASLAVACGEIRGYKQADLPNTGSVMNRSSIAQLLRPNHHQHGQHHQPPALEDGDDKVRHKMKPAPSLDLDSCFNLIFGCFALEGDMHDKSDVRHLLRDVDITFRSASMDCFGIVETGAVLARLFDDDAWPRKRLVVDAYNHETGLRASLRASRLRAEGWAVAQQRQETTRFEGDKGVIDGGPALTLDVYMPRLKMRNNVADGFAANLLTYFATHDRSAAFLATPSYRFAMHCDRLEVVASVQAKVPSVKFNPSITVTTKKKQCRAKLKILAVVRIMLRKRRNVAVFRRFVAGIVFPRTVENDFIEIGSVAVDVVDDEGESCLQIDGDGTVPKFRCKINLSECRIDGLLSGARVNLPAVRRCSTCAYFNTAVSSLLSQCASLSSTWMMVDAQVDLGSDVAARIGRLSMIFAPGDQPRTFSASWQASTIRFAVIEGHTTNVESAFQSKNILLDLRAATLTSQLAGPLRRCRVCTSTVRLALSDADFSRMAILFADAARDALGASDLRAGAIQIHMRRAHIRLLTPGKKLELNGSRLMCELRRVDANYVLSFGTRALALIDVISSEQYATAGKTRLSCSYRDESSDGEDDDSDGSAPVLTAKHAWHSGSPNVTGKEASQTHIDPALEHFVVSVTKEWAFTPICEFVAAACARL